MKTTIRLALAAPMMAFRAASPSGSAARARGLGGCGGLPFLPAASLIDAAPRTVLGAAHGLDGRVILQVDRGPDRQIAELADVLPRCCHGLVFRELTASIRPGTGHC